MGTGDRALNSRGQGYLDKLQIAVSSLFILIMVIYAGVRGHKVATQLPATFRTTESPKTLAADYTLLDHIFPSSNVPEATYEFPALTFCPPDQFTTVTQLGCYRASTATKTNCPAFYHRNLTFEGESLSCLTVNDQPTDVLLATSSDDVMEVTVSVVGTGAGAPQGTVVAAHPQRDPKETSAEAAEDWGFDNFFAAGVYTSTEIVGKKLYTVDDMGDWDESFEIKASSMRLKLDVDALEAAPGNVPFVRVEFRFPKLEATYEKSFLPLDMNNWLGEVGGVAALLFFLQRAFLAVTAFVLKRSDAFAYTDLGGNKNEGFAHY
ncbi:hypothetical protein HKX48_006593 [Thoreauomyces humboldtii]|nr:hypothetical protein HKX48_006593 [Thoreauomyces humboldtii]